MSGFRGSDEALDREIETLERMAKVRLRRYTRDLNELDRDLNGLKRERARRRVEAESLEPVPVPAEAVTSTDGE